MATGDEKFTCCQPEPLLPSERRPREQRAAAAPEVPHMGARIIDALGETDSGNETVGELCQQMCAPTAKLGIVR